MLKEGKFTAPVCEWGTSHAPHCSHGNMCACTVMWGPYCKSFGAHSCAWIIFHSASGTACWNISEINPGFCNNCCDVWVSSHLSCVFCLKCLESHDHLHRNTPYFPIWSYSHTLFFLYLLVSSGIPGFQTLGWLEDICFCFALGSNPFILELHVQTHFRETSHDWGPQKHRTILGTNGNRMKDLCHSLLLCVLGLPMIVFIFIS